MGIRIGEPSENVEKKVSGWLEWTLAPQPDSPREPMCRLIPLDVGRKEFEHILTPFLSDQPKVIDARISIPETCKTVVLHWCIDNNYPLMTSIHRVLLNSIMETSALFMKNAVAHEYLINTTNRLFESP